MNLLYGAQIFIFTRCKIQIFIWIPENKKKIDETSI